MDLEEINLDQLWQAASSKQTLGVCRRERISVLSLLVGILLLVEVQPFCPGFVLQWEYFVGIGPFNPFGFQFFHFVRIL